MVIRSLEATGARPPAIRRSALILAGLMLGAAVGAAQSPEPSGPPVAPALAGGVPGPAPEGPVTLTLRDAVERGLEHNLAVVLGREQVRTAAGARTAARSRVYPHLEATLADSRNVINLEAYGFPVPAGESPLIGPFDVLDARASVAAPLVDLSLWADARAAAHTADAATATLDDLRDQVVLAISGLYLGASAAESRIVSARAQVATAEALHDQAVDMKEAGVVAAIEVLRTEVQLADERERLIVATNDAATTKLALARAVGLPLSSELVLLEKLEYSPPPAVGVDEAVRQAVAQRSDYRGAQAALAAAEEAATAARTLVWPSLGLEANWGKVGPDLDSWETTYSVGAMMRLPLYSGGFIRSRKLVADAELADRQARLADLEARIEYEVRSTLLDLEAADQRARVAADAARLAESQLEQARDRFAAGVADGVEVVQAQQAAASAHDNRIASLLADSLARVRLARALGVAAEDLDRFIGGAS